MIFHRKLFDISSSVFIIKGFCEYVVLFFYVIHFLSQAIFFAVDTSKSILKANIFISKFDKFLKDMVIRI